MTEMSLDKYSHPHYQYRTIGDGVIPARSFKSVYVLYVSYFSALILLTKGLADLGWEAPEAVSGGRYVYSVICLLIFLSLIPRRNIPSRVFVSMLIAFVMVPSFALYTVGFASNEALLATCLGSLIVILFAKTPRIFWGKKTRIRSINPKYLVGYLIIAIASLTLAIYIISGQYLNFDFREVYKYRRTIADTLPHVFSYLVPTVSKVFIPLCVAILLTRKSYFLALMMLLASFFLFGLTAHKSIMFYPIFTGIFFYISLHRADHWAIPAAINVGLALTMLDNFLWSELNLPDAGWLQVLYIDRVLLAPSFLNELFIREFSGEAKYHWSFSKISMGLIEKPYSFPAPNLIGSVYFGNPDMSANTGFIGAGYSEAGWVGVTVYATFIGLLFSYLDRVSLALDTATVVGWFSPIILTMLSAAGLTDMLLTHGLIVALALAWILSGGSNRLRNSTEHSKG